MGRGSQGELVGSILSMRVALSGVAVGAVLLAIGCGASHSAKPSEAEVRALFARVASAGRAADFAHICKSEMSPALLQLDYLAGGDCASDLRAEWHEGVELAKIGSQTRVVIDGRKAVVFDGAAPDSAIKVRGRWLLAEFPRNRRHALVGEACQTARATDFNSGARQSPTVDYELLLGCSR